MLIGILKRYLKNIAETSVRGDAREESYYKHLDELIKQYAEIQQIENVDVTILPKKTEAGNPDFRIWDGRTHITGYIEAKDPSVTNLDYIEGTEQLERYLSTFPNVILTNFYEFRLYRDGQRMVQVMIGRPVIAQKLQTTPPVENVEPFENLFDLFFSFSLPKVQTARSLAVELAKRTRFLRDDVIAVEIAENGSKDENVFDIRQGVAIALFIKNKKAKEPKVYHLDKYGLREEKYDWLDQNDFVNKNYQEIKPASPWYFFVLRNTSHIQQYLKWKRIDKIFPVNVTGIVTARDRFVIGFDEHEIRNRMMQFRNLSLPDEIVAQAYNLKDKRG